MTMKLFEHVLYINLESRLDRRTNVVSQLSNLGVAAGATRFNAIRHRNGAIGCTMSHIRCLQMAIENDWESVFICEDDIVFSDVVKLKELLAKFGAIEGELGWDVLIIGGNNMPPYETIVATNVTTGATEEFLIRVKNCQTTTGYVVRRHYYAKLLENFKTGLKRLMETGDKRQYALDIYWKILQGTDNWFMLIPATVHQLDDYSDIEGKRTEYKELMLDYNKEKIIQRMIEYEKQNQPMGLIFR